MDHTKKARIQMEHWLNHSNSHVAEYEAFAAELEKAGKGESARYIREKITLFSVSIYLLFRIHKPL